MRTDFDQAFRRFSQSMDMMLPDPRALPYVGDLKWLGKVRQAARARYRDGRLDISDCGAKVRKLIEESIVADGVQVLVKEVSIFSKQFDKKLEQLKSDEARASEMEHAIRHEITVRLEENPAFYQSLRERLAQIIDDLRASRISSAEQLKLFGVLIDEVKNEARAADDLGLSPSGFAIYGVLERTAPSGVAGPRAEYSQKLRDLALVLDDAIEPHLEIVDWVNKDDVQREMRRSVKRRLRKAGDVLKGEIEDITSRIIDLARARNR